jgi:hypothetical protein
MCKYNASIIHRSERRQMSEMKLLCSQVAFQWHEKLDDIQVSSVSVTGYRRSLPLDKAGATLLATHVREGATHPRPWHAAPAGDAWSASSLNRTAKSYAQQSASNYVSIVRIIHLSLRKSRL